MNWWIVFWWKWVQ